MKLRLFSGLHIHGHTHTPDTSIYVPHYMYLKTPKSLTTRPWVPPSVPFKGKGKKLLFKIFVHVTVSHKPLVTMHLFQCAWNLMEGLVNTPLDS